MTKPCPDCGREVSTSAKHCPHCGKPSFTTTLNDTGNNFLSLGCLIFVGLVLWILFAALR